MNPIQKLLHPVFDYLGDIEDTELHQATRDGDLARMRYFLEEPAANVNVKNYMGQSALAQAAAGGNADCVRLLLDFGAMIDSSDIKAQTPLFLALRNQHLEVARILLMHNASPDGDLANAATPLSHAAWHGQNEAIKLLLEFGADVNSEKRDGRILDYQSPLSLAFAYQHLETVKLLLRSGADPDIGGHLYHQAVRKKYPLIYVQLLYEFGSNIYQKDNSKAYAWEIDQGTQNECAEFLKMVKDNPCCLKAICRISIRQIVGWKRMSRLKELEMLPKFLISYLCYSEYDDC